MSRAEQQSVAFTTECLFEHNRMNQNIAKWAYGLSRVEKQTFHTCRVGTGKLMTTFEISDIEAVVIFLVL